MLYSAVEVKLKDTQEDNRQLVNTIFLFLVRWRSSKNFISVLIRKSFEDGKTLVSIQYKNSNNKVRQRHIYDPIKDLKWSFFQKLLMAFNRLLFL